MFSVLLSVYLEVELMGLVFIEEFLVLGIFLVNSIWLSFMF